MFPTRPIWKALIVGLLTVAAGTTAIAEDPRPADSAESRGESADAARAGVAWLSRQQGADGGWHSETYGGLKAGVGNTALALLALTESGVNDDASRDAIDRGVRFLTKSVDRDGFVQAPDGATDYPVYATALLLRALQRRSLPAEATQRVSLRDALVRTQRTERNGWKPDDLDFGGWGHAFHRRDADRSDPSTISLTSHVLVALGGEGSLPADVQEAALRFLSRCQHRNAPAPLAGGFSYTPYADDPHNRAGAFAAPSGSEAPRPYLPPSCDGWLALAACGVAPEADTRNAALVYLIETTLTLPEQPGASTPEQRRQQGLLYYRAAAWAGVWQASRDPRLASGRAALVQALASRQERDGAWRNPEPSMREDDPLIATSFALLALSRLSRAD